jgi:hypothetical protein
MSEKKNDVNTTTATTGGTGVWTGSNPAVAAYYAVQEGPIIGAYMVQNPRQSPGDCDPDTWRMILEGIPQPLQPLAPTPGDADKGLAWEMLKRLLEVFDERGREIERLRVENLEFAERVEEVEAQLEQFEDPE